MEKNYEALCCNCGEATLTSSRYLVDVSEIFNFFCSGEGKGESEATGRGGGRLFYWKSQEGGCGVLPGERGGR